MQISPETMRLLMEMDAPAEQKVALMRAMEADWLAYQAPGSINGVNEERERLRNESTYAERKRKNDRERQARQREELRRLKAERESLDESSASSRRVVGEATATEGGAAATTGDAPLALPPSPQTPQPPTPTRESVTSREAREREEAAFAKFWAAYPRKTAKADARKAFAKAWRKLPPLDEEPILIGGLERAKASWTDAQFIPHAATWLNGERWQDEPAEVIPLNARKPHERPDPHAAKFAARQANLATHERGADLAARLYREPG